jgi:hypothetical protein
VVRREGLPHGVSTLSFCPPRAKTSPCLLGHLTQLHGLGVHYPLMITLAYLFLSLTVLSPVSSGLCQDSSFTSWRGISMRTEFRSILVTWWTPEAQSVTWNQSLGVVRQMNDSFPLYLLST